MTLKILQPYTVIPPNLYVERNADRQLNDVVQHMGRPAYVLVARQMGKTNLLLHMKREREKCGDAVLYFDLSAKASSLRNQLRDIVDQIIDNPKIEAAALGGRIERDRSEQLFEPAREFDRHIRLILRSFADMRFVIVLDEVDSLTTSSYSDAFFALIRSMYFSRVNFPEYERLTYTLAGVAEPTDLIKDKAISPFNIGEKIYLDDFTRSEFESLVKQAELRLSPDIVDHIYDWCRGSPRMSWDILSAIEDEMQDGHTLDLRRVDAAVEKLYLAGFDRAPVDHIRVLTASDPVIRNAVVALRWGKSETIDDITKSRLYLAGIISGFSTSGLSIKNKVLDAALSDEWLEQVTAADAGLLEAAAKEFSLKRFGATVTLLEEYIKSNPSVSLPVDSQVRMGVSMVQEGRDEEAIPYLQTADSQILGNDSAASVNYYLATALFKTGDVAQSLIHLRKKIDRGDFENAARLSLTSALINQGQEEGLTEAIEVSLDLQSHLKELNRELLQEEREILASSFYNLAMALKGLERIPEAIEALQEAHRVAPVAFKPGLTLARRQFARTVREKESWAAQAAKEILEFRLMVEGGASAALRFSEDVLASTVEALLQTAVHEELAVELVEYHSRNLPYGPHKPFSTVLRIADGNRRLSDKARSVMYWFAIDHFRESASNPSDVLGALRAIIQSNGVRLKEAWARYVLELWRSDDYALGEDDFSIIFAKTIDYMKEKDNAALLQLVESVLPLKREGPSSTVFDLLLRYHRMVALQNLRRQPQARETAKEILDTWNERPVLGTEADADTRSTMEFVLQQAFDYYHSSVHDPLRNIGRNERVHVRDNRTNRESVSKFKYVEHELRAGSLTLLKKAEVRPIRKSST